MSLRQEVISGRGKVQNPAAKGTGSGFLRLLLQAMKKSSQPPVCYAVISLQVSLQIRHTPLSRFPLTVTCKEPQVVNPSCCQVSFFVESHALSHFSVPSRRGPQ
jgi:hypothetical protein